MEKVFDINNFAIDHVLRGIMTSGSDGSLMWSINQISEPSLSVTTENAQAVDALGGTIVEFDRAKKAEFSAQNSLFDLSLYAAQQGNEKKVADKTETVTAPAFETITVPAVVTDPVRLSHKPNTAPTEIYYLKGDDTLGQAVKRSDTSGAGVFTYDEATQAITFPTDAKPGDPYFVQYEYEATQAVSVTGDAINFPKSGKFIMEVLGTDICNPSTLIHAFIVFPNAKLDANVDVSFTTDGNHPFKIRANQSYCDRKKVLFKIVIPADEMDEEGGAADTPSEDETV